VQSVATILINTTEGANDPFVYDKISKAEGLFIAGGDQYQYVSLWNNTKVQQAIVELVARNVPIGTSLDGEMISLLGDSIGDSIAILLILYTTFLSIT
jgi:cyanophycinase-like exopeptidase